MHGTMESTQFLKEMLSAYLIFHCEGGHLIKSNAYDYPVQISQ